MEQDPYRVAIELRGGGWPGAIARVQNCWVSCSGVFAPNTESGVRFTRVEIDALILQHAPAMLVLQGMLLQDLFAPDTFFIDQETQLALVRGPWVLLKGALSERWATPLRIDGVVLAALEHVPAGLTRNEVLAELLSAIR